MAAKVTKRFSSIGPVRALALKHVPALIILHRHVDCDWSEIEYAAEQIVSGFYYPEEVDQLETEKENEVQNETRFYDAATDFRPTSTESRRRSPEENEGREVEGAD